MSRDPSNSDWLERNLESARRRVNQLEIDACRIRTDLARLEVANASGVAQAGAAPDIEIPVANGNSVQVLDWQPAAEQIPEGMEILVGEPPDTDAPLTLETSEQVVAPVTGSESWA
jgi:hypothetical protein